MNAAFDRWVRLWEPASPTPPEVQLPSGQYGNLSISPTELVARTAGDPPLLVLPFVPKSGGSIQSSR